MIEIGEYVRTKDGHIAKYIEKLVKDEDVADAMLFDSYIYEKNKHIRYIFLKEIIVKHSKQLIDLVEIKDICMFENNCVYIYDNEFLNAIKENVKNGNRLLKVLTKEQFEQNSYKVGEEDE